MLFRDANGVNFGKIYAKQIFNPPNPVQAKDQISGLRKDYVLSKTPYESSAQAST